MKGHGVNKIQMVVDCAQQLSLQSACEVCARLIFWPEGTVRVKLIACQKWENALRNV